MTVSHNYGTEYSTAGSPLAGFTAGWPLAWRAGNS